MRIAMIRRVRPWVAAVSATLVMTVSGHVPALADDLPLPQEHRQGIELIACAVTLTDPSNTGTAACQTPAGAENGTASIAESTPPVYCDDRGPYVVEGLLTIALPSGEYSAPARIDSATNALYLGTGQSGAAAWGGARSYALCQLLKGQGDPHPSSWDVSASFDYGGQDEAGFDTVPTPNSAPVDGLCDGACRRDSADASSPGPWWRCDQYVPVAGRWNSYALGNCFSMNFYSQYHQPDPTNTAGYVWLLSWFGGANLQTCGWVKDLQADPLHRSNEPDVTCGGGSQGGRPNSSFIHDRTPCPSGYSPPCFWIWQHDIPPDAQHPKGQQDGFQVSTTVPNGKPCHEYANLQPWHSADGGSSPVGPVDTNGAGDNSHTVPGVDVWLRYRTRFDYRDPDDPASYPYQRKWYLVHDHRHHNTDLPAWVFISGRCLQPNDNNGMHPNLSGMD